MKRIFICLLLYAAIAAVAMPSAEARTIKVLHVSEVMQSEVQAFIDDTGMGSLFEVTQVSYWDDYHHGPPDNLEDYDVIVFGLNDCLDVVRDLDELYWFVDSGGGVVFTHDSAANINPLAVRNMVGVGDWIDPDPPAPDWVWGNSAEILQDHAVLHCPFEIGTVGEIVDIQRTHTVVMLQSGDKILKLPGLDDGSNWYLAAKKFGAGRVVVSQIGHSVYQCYVDPHQIPEPGEPPVLREQQLFVNCLFWAAGGVIEVSIDIKPDSFANSINPHAGGVIPVAILTTADFDASTVDPETVALDGAGARGKGKSGKYGSMEDVDGDGDLDLVVQVVNEINWAENATEATLTGETWDGIPIKGTDSVRIVPPE